MPYNPTWPQVYAENESLISCALGANYVSMHHVGSTSVPGLAAKPIIDVVVEVNAPHQSIEQLEGAGYRYKGAYNIPSRYYFNNSDGSANIHVYPKGDPEVRLNLMFRDYLISNPSKRDAYTRIKMALVAQPDAGVKNASGFTRYNTEKGLFVKKCLREAGWGELRVLICTTNEEFVASKLLRQQHFAHKNEADTYDWACISPHDKHFVLYRGVDIIGYAYVTLKNSAACETEAWGASVITVPNYNTGSPEYAYLQSCCINWLNRKNS